MTCNADAHITRYIGGTFNLPAIKAETADPMGAAKVNGMRRMPAPRGEVSLTT